MLDARGARLLAGDVVALLAFTILGRRTHDEAVGLAAALDVVTTAAPFVVAWVVAALALGGASTERTTTPASMVVYTLLTWEATLPLAIALRALMLGRFSPWTFYLVAAIVPLLFLLAWRTAFVIASRRTSPRDASMPTRL